MMDRMGFQTYPTSSPSSLPSLASAGAASLGGQAAVCLRPEPVWSGRREAAAVTQEKKTEAIHQQRVSEKYISQLFQSFLGSTARSGSPRNPAQPAHPGVTATMDSAPSGNLESNDVVIFQIGATISWPGRGQGLGREAGS